MTFSPATSDEHQLAHVHPDLKKVVQALFATSPMPFRVLEGARTREQQRKNIAAGVSWTMNSRHIPGRNGYAHAVDLAPLVNGDVTWDWAVYRRFAPIVRATAASVGVPLEWGGDWRKTPDAPHWQLPRRPGYAAIGGPAGAPDDCCGAAHPMFDSEAGSPENPDSLQPPATGPGKWATALFGGGGIGLFGGYGYGLPPIVILAVAGLAALAVVAFFITIGHERRERLWDGMVGGLAK
jgi:peptidoglycan L-alanyl-D-glutamate endopeptidase CwlK